MPWTPPNRYPQSPLDMDVQLDAASTSDAEERELLEAANFDLYWDRVKARSHLDRHRRSPNASSDHDDEMQGCTSRMSAHVEVHPSSSHPHPHASSSPVAHESLRRSVSENSTTPGFTGHELPTSPPTSPHPATSPVSSFHHQPHRPRWQDTNRNSLISSPDPLLLSSSSRTYYADADDHKSRPTDHAEVLQTTSNTTRLDGDPGAAPVASLSLSMYRPSREVRSQQLSPSPDTFSVVRASPTPDVNHDSALAIGNDTGTAGGRYSMRMRQPRQLKPYAIDRLEYKHQLKHHPDAIVKFAGRRSPVEPSSLSGEGDTDDTAENSAGENPSEEARKPSRSNGKKRHRASAGHPSAPFPIAHRRMSAVQPSSGPPFPGRRLAESSAIADIALVTTIPDVDGDGSPGEAATWYPDAFNDFSSGLGSDDMPISTHQNDLRDSHTSPPQVKRRRRALRRRLPRLSPLASPDIHLSGPSSPLSGPVSLGAISVDASSNSSSSGSESMQRSDDDVALLSESSEIMLIDDRSPSLSPKLERSPPRSLQKRRLQPSKHPVITDFFTSGPSKKKRPRKRGIVPAEKTSRPKHLGSARASDLQSANQRNSKSRARRQHERSRRPADLSVFTVASGRIMSGWQKRNAVTIDTEDVAFRRALEPLAPRARQSPPNRLPPPEVPRIRRPPRQAPRGPINRVASSSTMRVIDPAPEEETRHHIVVDLDIPNLPPGKVYAAGSYLGKGWLYELLSTVSGTPLSYPPPAIEVDGHGLSSVSTALDYTVFLPNACDSFAKVLNDSSEISYETFTSWNTTMHGVCLLVSWILAFAEGDDAHLIRTASLEYTGSLVARIDTAFEDSGDQAKSLSSTILCLHWFAVELLVRACWSTTSSDKDLSTAINARVAGMANRLLQVGSPATVLQVVANHESLDDFSLYPCVAELWVCLVHLGTHRGREPGATGEGSFPSMVEILRKSLAAAKLSPQAGLQASEEIWGTLFGLGALSKFSAHGVSTSTARMGTSWELVLLALDHIRLVADPQVDASLSTRNLRRRDAYIRLIVSRCLILHQRWSWRLDYNVSATLFQRLVEIFKSRKFADLRGEIAGFAAFVQENDANLLEADASTDSAFTIFLKLIYASAQEMRPSLREDEYLGRTKKLLSLVTPVGSVQHQLSAISSPVDKQLSMLYNRFSSLALAIRVQPSAENIIYRVSLARRYVDFPTAAAATRSVCIRAANFLALQALDMALPVGPALEWTSEMAQVLIPEFRAASIVEGTVAAPPANDTHDAQKRRTELVPCIQLLLSGFQDVSRKSTVKDTSMALELLQKGCFFSVLVEAKLCAIPTIQALLQGIVNIHLNHALSLQEGQDPPLQDQHPKPIQEESQDEYGQFDLNWDDPMVLAALNNAVEPAPIVAPAPMQYTYQSLVEHIKNALPSPTIFENIIHAFENQRQQEVLRTGAESVS